jgi:EmrB/QacA subfamily drug resistance transporter
MSATALAPRSTSPSAAPDRRSWATLAVVALAQFMVILDATVVNVALPSIGESLGFAAADLQWVVTAYVLFTGGLMLLGGRATDLFGRRAVFLAGLGVFTSASLASGLAWSPTALIVARAVQGLGAALLVPAALAIVTTTYEGAQRRTALAIWGALGSAGAAAGVLLGGVITTALGWEWVFFVNVPVGVGVALGAARLVPGTAGQRAGTRLDLRGAVVVMAGLVTLVYALDGAPQHGWGSARTLALLGVGAALLAAFAVIERRGADPLVPASTWRMRPLIASAAIMLGATGILVGAFFLNTLYMQRVLGDSALETGLAFLPLTVVILLAAHIASQLLEQVGSRVVVLVGATLMGGGALLLAAAPDRASYLQDLLPGLLVLGLGVGLTFVAASVTAMAEVRHEQAGLASGLMTTAHELGAALGVAVLSAVALSSSGGFAAGYGSGFIAAAAIAALLAVVAMVALPSVRPAPGTRVALH